MITVHVVIGGFTQRRTRWHGCMRLHEQLLEQFPTTLYSRFWFQRWNDHWDEIAEHVWLLTERHQCAVRVCIYAFSWGAGFGAQKFARCLDDADVSVRAMVLCDPVYRHWYPLGNWRAFWPYSKISVPPNVKELWSFFQRRNYPMGHALVPECDKTEVHPPIQLDTVHMKMDDHHLFHRKVIEVVRLVSQEEDKK